VGAESERVTVCNQANRASQFALLLTWCSNPGGSCCAQPNARTMSIQEEFDAAVELANKLPSQSNEVMLELYGWFKQANVGDVNTGACR
jgi:hypothetical protein